MNQKYRIPNFLEDAFDNEFSYTDAENNIYQFYRKDMGDLNIHTGHIIACDPFLYNKDKPFNEIFPEGSFPVELAIAKVNTDERVGFSRIKFSENKPVKWTMAIIDDQDPSTLLENEIFGYAVDAGCGSFMDASGGDKLYDFMVEEMDNYMKLIDDLEKQYKNTWSWLMWGNNDVAIFSSGWGDGVYATYIGYDAENKICRLVTNFELLD